VHVDTAVFWKVKEVLFDDLSVRYNDTEIRLVLG